MSFRTYKPSNIASRKQIGEAAELRYHIPNGDIRKLLHSIVHSPDPPNKKYGSNPFAGKINQEDPLANCVLRLAQRMVTDLVPAKKNPKTP